MRCMQSLVRIPETLVCAMEFINLPTPAEHNMALDDLRKIVLRHNPDLKEKPLFWKRKGSVLKVLCHDGARRYRRVGGR